MKHEVSAHVRSADILVITTVRLLNNAVLPDVRIYPYMYGFLELQKKSTDFVRIWDKIRIFYEFCTDFFFFVMSLTSY